MNVVEKYIVEAGTESVELLLDDVDFMIFACDLLNRNNKTSLLTKKWLYYLDAARTYVPIEAILSDTRSPLENCLAFIDDVVESNESSPWWTIDPTIFFTESEYYSGNLTLGDIVVSGNEDLWQILNPSNGGWLHYIDVCRETMEKTMEKLMINTTMGPTYPSSTVRGPLYFNAEGKVLQSPVEPAVHSSSSIYGTCSLCKEITIPDTLLKTLENFKNQYSRNIQNTTFQESLYGELVLFVNKQTTLNSFVEQFVNLYRKEYTIEYLLTVLKVYSKNYRGGNAYVYTDYDSTSILCGQCKDASSIPYVEKINVENTFPNLPVVNDVLKELKKQPTITSPFINGSYVTQMNRYYTNSNIENPPMKLLKKTNFYQEENTWFDYNVGPYGLKVGSIVCYRTSVEVIEDFTFSIGIVQEYDYDSWYSSYERDESISEQKDKLLFLEDFAVKPTRIIVAPMIPFLGINVVQSIEATHVYPLIGPLPSVSEFLTNNRNFDAYGIPVKAPENLTLEEKVQFTTKLIDYLESQYSSSTLTEQIVGRLWNLKSLQQLLIDQNSIIGQTNNLQVLKQLFSIASTYIDESLGSQTLDDLIQQLGNKSTIDIVDEQLMAKVYSLGLRMTEKQWEVIKNDYRQTKEYSIFVDSEKIGKKPNKRLVYDYPTRTKIIYRVLYGVLKFYYPDVNPTTWIQVLASIHSKRWCSIYKTYYSFIEFQWNTIFHHDVSFGDLHKFQEVTHYSGDSCEQESNVLLIMESLCNVYSWTTTTIEGTLGVFIHSEEPNIFTKINFVPNNNYYCPLHYNMYNFCLQYIDDKEEMYIFIEDIEYFCTVYRSPLWCLYNNPLLYDEEFISKFVQDFTLQQYNDSRSRQAREYIERCVKFHTSVFQGERISKYMYKTF